MKNKKKTTSSNEGNVNNIAIAVAVIGLLGTVIAAYFNYLANTKPSDLEIAIFATQTAESKFIFETQSQQIPIATATPTVSLALTSQNVKITSTPSIPTPISNHTATPQTETKEIAGEIAFSENFDTGYSNKFRPFPNGSFYITKDETGNFVYEIANFSSSEFPTADFGSSTWKNYAVEYKVRFLDYKGTDTQATLYIRKAYRGGSGYHIELVPSINRIRLAYYNNTWAEITSEEYLFEKNIWYLIRAEVKENEIKFFVNNKEVIYAIDKRLENGELALMAGPGTYAQFDDIKVMLFDE